MDVEIRLKSAVREGRIDEVREIIDLFGLSHSEASWDGYGLLYEALENNQTEVAKLLLTNGAEVNSECVIQSYTPLHFAAAKGDVDIVEMLLRAGANIDAQNTGGVTPLYCATLLGYKDVVKVLLESGANADSKTKSGKTILHVCAQRGYPEILKTLLTFENISLEIRCHIVKLKTAKLYVSESNLVFLSEYDETGFQDECEKEVESMKRENISNSNISFYDILTKGKSSLAMCMRNDNVYQVLKSEDYESKFPLYASTIKCHLKKGMVRKELLEQSHEFYHFLSYNVLKIPYECVENIFSYLSDKDLEMLIDSDK